LGSRKTARCIFENSPFTTGWGSIVAASGKQHGGANDTIINLATTHTAVQKVIRLYELILEELSYRINCTRDPDPHVVQTFDEQKPLHYTFVYVHDIVP